jgi:hypothetical protein
MSGVIRASAWMRLDVALRVMAAVPLNYALTSLIVVLIARILPGGPVQAALGATLPSFTIFALIAMAAFAARSGFRFVLGMIAAGALVGALDWLLLAGGRV